jgi:hypothetical protein
MPDRIELSKASNADLQPLRLFDKRRIIDEMKAQLTCEPDVPPI